MGKRYVDNTASNTARILCCKSKQRNQLLTLQFSPRQIPLSEALLEAKRSRSVRTQVGGEGGGQRGFHPCRNPSTRCFLTSASTTMKPPLGGKGVHSYGGTAGNASRHEKLSVLSLDPCSVSPAGVETTLCTQHSQWPWSPTPSTTSPHRHTLPLELPRPFLPYGLGCTRYALHLGD